MSEMNSEDSPEEFKFEEPIVTIGQFLRSEREQKNITLKVVSQHTKVSLTMLTYLENEDYESLPDLVYVRGFVKNYCKTLGVPEEMGLRILEETYTRINKNTADIKAEAESLQTPTPIEDNQNFKVLGIVAIALVFIGIIVTMTRSGDKTHSTDKVAEKPVEKVTPKKAKATPKPKVIKPTTLSSKTPLNKEMPTPLPTVKVVATPLPTAEATPAATPKPTPVAKATATPEVKTADNTEKPETNQEEKKEEKKEIVFKNLSSTLYTFSPDTEAAISEHMPGDIKSSVVSGKQNVFIKATDGDTWITYKSDEGPVKKFILKQGRHILIRGDEVTAFLGNVNVTKIFLNNKLLDINSRTGVKSLVFPQERTDKHKYPLFIYNEDGSVTSSYDYMQKQSATDGDQ